MSNVPEKYSDIPFKPPVSVSRKAKKGLLLQETLERGGGKVSLKIAQLLRDRTPLSMDEFKSLARYFERHHRDRRTQYYKTQFRPTNGRIKWLLHGGDAGRKWTAKISAQIEDIDQKAKREKNKDE